MVVVSAGRPRTPGMTRAALAEVNGRVIRDVGAAIAAHAPGAVVVVVTNPVDEMTHELWRSAGLADDRVIGMAGTLDSRRFRFTAGSGGGVSPADVEAMTLGSHGDEMVPVVSRATIKGRPVRDVLTPDVVARCVQDTVDGGAAVVALRRTGSAFVAPAHAVVEVLDALRGAVAAPVPVSVRVHGAYGIDDVFVGVPARLSPRASPRSSSSGSPATSWPPFSRPQPPSLPAVPPTEPAPLPRQRVRQWPGDATVPGPKGTRAPENGSEGQPSSKTAPMSAHVLGLADRR